MSSNDLPQIIKVLITLHPGMNTLDFAGPVEVLSQTRHIVNNEGEWLARNL